MADINDLANEVANLTTATTNLVEEVVGQKTRLEDVADSARVEADRATTRSQEAYNHSVTASNYVADAAAEVVKAQGEVTKAKAEVTNAQAKVTLATNEANRAKAEADRATEVTGLDTVEAAVDMAMLAKNPYGAMTKAEYDALREQRKRENDGSGFKEWGKHYNHVNPKNINEGLWQPYEAIDPTSAPNALYFGRESTSNVGGISATDQPVILVDGKSIEPEHVGTSLDYNKIAFPPAPDGTKTLNKITGEIRKYTNKAGIGVQHDAYTVDFNDSNYVQLPVYTLPVGSKISLKFNHSLSANNDFIFDGDAADRGFIYIAATSNTLKSSGLQIDALNGSIWSASTTIQDGVEYHLEATTTAEISIGNIGANYTGWERFEGQIWDFKTTDADTGEVRHYPILIHDDVANGAPVTTEVRNIAEENPRDGYVVGYDADGYVVVPEFPLAAAMDISMAVRLDDDANSCVFGRSESGHNFYIFHDQPNANFKIAVGNWVGTHAALKSGRTYYIDISIRQQIADPTKYDITSTVNGDTQFGIGRTFLNDTFDSFGLGGYGNGDVAGNRWLGQIYDFLIQYPDAPDMNRYYEGFDSNNPEGQLFVRDEYGFGLDDWGVDCLATTEGAHVAIPKFTSANFNVEAVMVFDELDGANRLTGQLEQADSTLARCYIGKNDKDAASFGFGAQQNDFGAIANVKPNYPHHYKMEVRDNTATCYFDGVYMGTLTSSILTSLDNFVIGGTGREGKKTSNQLKGTVLDLRLTDLDNPANSRYYPLTINSVAQPSDDASIVDESYDKTVAPFYSAAWSEDGLGAAKHIQIPVWQTKAGDQLKMKVVWGGVANRGLFDGTIGDKQSYVFVTTDGLISRLFCTHTVDGVEGGKLIAGQEHELVFTFTDNTSVGTIGNLNTEGNSWREGGRIWDIELIDNTDPTNSRYYPGTVYSPDAVPTGTVFEETMQVNRCVDPSFSNGLVDWSIIGEVTDNGDGTVTLVDNGIDAVLLQNVITPITTGHVYEYTLQVEAFTKSTNNDIRIYGDTVNIGIADSLVVGENKFYLTLGRDIANNSASARISVTGEGASITISSFEVKHVADGTLTNFSAGSEWTLAQVDGLTEATAENFTGAVWTNTLPNTDAAMTNFTTPWVAYSTALHGEVVGTDTWVSSAMKASQKAFDYASIEVNADVIISRKDLSFLEVWDERISDKGILCPLGSVQYGGSPFLGINQYGLTGYGIEQGYSAYGEWDTTTEGKVCKVTNLTEEQLKAFYADPRNNVYWNPEDGEYYQTRFRVRTIEGISDACWDHVRWSADKASSIGAKAGNTLLYLHPQEARETVVDLSKNFTANGFSVNRLDSRHNSDDGVWFCSSTGTVSATQNAVVFSVPIALTQRMNQGAYHPVLNPMGCDGYPNIYGTGMIAWYGNVQRKDELDSTVKCFIKADGYPRIKETGFTYGYGHIAGTSSIQSRQDQYQYYDAIYAGQVEDLRLPTKLAPLTEVREIAVRKAVSGAVRGKGSIPVTRVNMANQLAVSGSTSAFDECYDDLTQSPKIGDICALEDENGDFHVRTIRSLSGNGTIGFEPPLTTGRKTDSKVLLTSWELGAEFDSLPWVDIIGHPERIAATFPDGIVGQWNPNWIPSGGGATPNVELIKKFISAPSRLQTLDDGASWTYVTNTNQDAIKNTILSSSLDTLDSVHLVYYEVMSDFTELDSNRAVVGELGDVFVGGRNTVWYSNRLMPSLIGKVGKLDYGKQFEYVTLDNYAIQGAGLIRTASTDYPTHTSIGLNSSNESDAVKALPHLIEKGGLIYMQWHATQLKHNGTDWGDDSKITVVDNGNSTKTDQNGNVVKIVTHTNMIPVGIAPKY